MSTMIRLSRDNMAEAEAHLRALAVNPDTYDPIDTVRAIQMVLMELGTLRNEPAEGCEPRGGHCWTDQPNPLGARLLIQACRHCSTTRRFTREPGREWALE